MRSSAAFESTCMDDTMYSVTDDWTAIKLYNELSKLWQLVGMYARKWLSNSAEVLETKPEADNAENIDLDSGELPSIKTLGIVCNAKDDVFTHIFEESDTEYTKRLLLKKMATLFDPLSPYVITNFYHHT